MSYERFSNSFPFSILRNNRAPEDEYYISHHRPKDCGHGPNSQGEGSSYAHRQPTHHGIMLSGDMHGKPGGADSSPQDSIQRGGLVEAVGIPKEKLCMICLTGLHSVEIPVEKCLAEQTKLSEYIMEAAEKTPEKKDFKV